jgi:hypothetical protein
LEPAAAWALTTEISASRNTSAKQSKMIMPLARGKMPRYRVNRIQDQRVNMPADAGIFTVIELHGGILGACLRLLFR